MVVLATFPDFSPGAMLAANWRPSFSESKTKRPPRSHAERALIALYGRLNARHSLPIRIGNGHDTAASRDAAPWRTLSAAGWGAANPYYGRVTGSLARTAATSASWTLSTSLSLRVFSG